ncbi:MAG: hypothetical protein E5V21_22210 [Mesorhizobium sp.]|nr:MAG: hypothetical protein E5V21_22210 [Mesorhizobium sp.]
MEIDPGKGLSYQDMVWLGGEEPFTETPRYNHAFRRRPFDVVKCLQIELVALNCFLDGGRACRMLHQHLEQVSADHACQFVMR